MSEGALYAVIMAGGSGTRFWPLSRRRLPKQFLAIGDSERSLIRSTYERVEDLAPGRVLVVGNRAHVERTRAELPELREDRILAEPVGRNTAPCIGFAARWIEREDPSATMLVVPADHVIRPKEAFEEAVRFGVELLDRLGEDPDPPTVTMGIVPREPATGFGYIEEGDLLFERGGLSGHRVRAFKEKPDRATAEEYLRSGRYLWNAGIFIWRVSGVLELVRRYLPELAAGLDRIMGEAGDPEAFARACEAEYPNLPAISIDYAVLERTRNVGTVRAGFEWDDVGSWTAAARYFEADGDGNRVRGRHFGLETKNCVVYSGGRLVATVGVEDLVVVETPDALLVCHRDEVESVRKLVEGLEKNGHHDVL